MNGRASDPSSGVTEAQVVIRNQLGLHARACVEFVRVASRFKSQVMVARDDLEVNGKSILGVMMLAAEQGATIRIRCEGEDEVAVLAALVALVENRFGEES